MMVGSTRFLLRNHLGLIAAVAISLLFWQSLAQAADPVEVRIGLVAREPNPPVLYEVDPVPEDEGLAGGRQAIQDNNTTGRFTGHRYSLKEVLVPADGDPAEAARALVAEGIGFIVAKLPADDLLKVADALKGSDAVLFNATAPDDRLRGAECRQNVFHLAPSRAMLTDALAQFLAFKRWRKIFLIVGPNPADRLYADAMKKSARKFGLQLAAEQAWTFGPLARAKADSPTTAEALVFTRGVDYDVAIVADEAADWGDYVPYRTWDPRIVAGTQGLISTTWHPTLEVWGATQAQTRFQRLAQRLMRPVDYQVWMAVRSVGEAVTKSKKTDPGEVGVFLRGPDFALPGYKGVPLTFRTWDQQLRQPILIVQPKALVSVAPEQGFLHQRTPLDTLGTDAPESECKL
ncbi:ABC transporter substrate-binding protein [Microvirga massiliensis]|uniref:ABC transporter substrate-binding protein n=1 Tax=Microvirga massiliensis TaxID=1033741 RepID=UPI00062B3FA3|nr:ABC transporter substrate-binding protein [Microvirga massiliensis]